MIVIADTTPLNYLIVIGQQELLPVLFGQVIIPFSLAFRHLKQTSFYMSPAVEQFFLARDRQRKAASKQP